MSRLLSSALSLRSDPRILKIPPYLSFLCILIGIGWLLLLPLDDYSRKTYISENALLPGQVHTYFGGSEHHVLRAYRHEIDEIAHKTTHDINDKIEEILRDVGIKVGRQSYKYHAAGTEYSGENVYGILQAPRGDATEAIVLVAAWKSIEGQLNRNGVALALTLARYFKRWSLWSKDIIFVFPPDSRTGTQAWVDAYHDAHDGNLVAPLPLKSGALQGALAIDYPLEEKFEAMHVIYDGTNGQLPNLDLVNSVVNIAGGQMGIHSFIQNMRKHDQGYADRLNTIVRGMVSQALGSAAGPHSSFIPYHVDAITLQPYGKGWHDEMAMGRVVEGSFRSLNNLLEHLHQSFFFYLLMQKDRFVSIGTYLPSAMILAANFTIMAIFLRVKTGQSKQDPVKNPQDDLKNSAEVEKIDQTKRQSALVPGAATVTKSLVLPVAIVAGFHAISVVPFYIFNHTDEAALPMAFANFTGISGALPFTVSHILATLYQPSVEQLQLAKAFSLLVLGVALSTLSTLNFSLAFFISLLAAPLSFAQPPRSQTLRLMSIAALNLISPTLVVYGGAFFSDVDISYVLKEASFGWNVWGMYTPLVVWAIWWPAWQIGMLSILGAPSEV